MASIALVLDTRPHLPERRIAPDPRALRREQLEALFVSSLPVIDRAVAHVLRRTTLGAPEREDFRSEVHLAFIRNDYRILDRFHGRSSLHTYLFVVVKRQFIDHQRRLWGKWRPSTVARRLGPLALRLERLIHRDGHPVAAAIERLGPRDGTHRAELSELARRLSARQPRRWSSDEELMRLPAGAWASPDGHLASDGDRARAVRELERALGSFGAEDSLVMRLHYVDGLSVAAIARALTLDQKALYRRIQRLLAHARRELRSRGIEWTDAQSLLERGVWDLQWWSCRRLSRSLPAAPAS